MPRYRKLHVKTLESLDIHSMPDDFTRLFWVLLALGVDSAGRGVYSPSWLRAKIFPLRDDIDDRQIAAAMKVFCDLGMIATYEIEGKPVTYFYIVNWENYQGDTSREMESFLPEPPELTNSRVSQELVATNSRVSHESVKTNSRLNTNTNTNTNTLMVEQASTSAGKELLLLESSGAGMVLLDALSPEAAAKGRQPPRYFGSYQQKDAFTEYYKVLGHDEFEYIVNEAVKKERLSRNAILDYVKAAVRNLGKDKRKKERDKKVAEKETNSVLEELKKFKETENEKNIS